MAFERSRSKRDRAAETAAAADHVGRRCDGRRMNKLVSAFTGGVSLLLLTSWLGASVFFSTVVAPTAFEVLRSFQVPNMNEIAGTIVTRALSVINVSGVVISLSLLALTVSAE